MTQGTPASIAWRYLRHKKSRGSVNAIAAISVVGVAIATAAILCVLSVFNGFKDILADRNALMIPDLEITPVAGKVIANADSLAEVLRKEGRIAEAAPMVEDQALAIFNMHEMPVMVRGVEFPLFRKILSIDSIIVAGEKIPDDPLSYDPPAGIISPGVAQRLRSFSSDDHIFLFSPRRKGRINIANPAMSFFTDSITALSVFESRQNELDVNSIYVPIEVARGIFQYDEEATSIIAKGAADTTPEQLAQILRDRLGDNYNFKTRYERQEINFRMVNIEKWITALLLFFILIIASFNIISTMTMIVIEKKGSISIFRSLGMKSSAIGRIFAWESFYITSIGAISGLILGIVLCLLQEHYGFINLGGDEATMIIQKYPVKLLIQDIIPVGTAVMLTGLFTSLIASSFARSRISGKHR